MEAITPAPRVIIVNYAGHSYDGARKYGEFITMTRGYISFESLDRLKYEIAQFIFTQTHREDWLLLSGIPAVGCIATTLWMRHHGKVKLLVWDKKTRNKYRPVEIDEENYQRMVEEILGPAVA